MHQKREWSRGEAEKHIRDVFENAKSHSPQTVRDSDGVFEIRFVGTVPKEPLGKFLARGGPDSD